MGADDKTENKVEEITGDAKEQIGGATGDDELRARGQGGPDQGQPASRPARRSRTPSRTDQHRPGATGLTEGPVHQDGPLGTSPARTRRLSPQHAS